ncbi:MAG: hypothetical protein AAFW68_11050 [Pseudomonadota bacterium]
MSSKYPKITSRLASMLESIEPSVNQYGLRYYPCDVELKNKRRANCVYFCEAEPWHSLWGIWPEDDEGKSSVDINNVLSISESPMRLPAKVANKIYQAGESGMGYSIFTVCFANGHEEAYGTGNAIDFISYPQGLGPGDVVGVKPHIGRLQIRKKAIEYSWCLFET